MRVSHVINNWIKQYITTGKWKIIKKTSCKMDEPVEASDINTIVFYDIETTGLPGHGKGRTRITELSLCACRTYDLQRSPSKRLPRIINKINLVLNPHKTIDPGSTDVTGLTNEMLEFYGGFDENIFRIVESFLLHLPSPVCLLAHNGAKFDFPILASELKSIEKWLPDDILCADSLSCFREIFGVNKAKKVLFPPANNGIPQASTSMPMEIDGLIPLTPKKTPVQNSSAVTPPPPSTSNVADPSSAKNPSMSTPDKYMKYLKDEFDEQLMQLAEQVERQYVAQTPPNQKIVTVTPSAPQKLVRARDIQEIRSMQQQNESTPQRPFDINRPKSFRLVDIYTHLTECPVPPNLHSAEADCLALLHCVTSSAPEVLEWLKLNAVPFTKFKK